MSLVRQAVKATFIIPLVVFYTSLSLLQMVIMVIRYGPRAYFSKKLRVQPPKCLQDPSLGAHGYTYLEEVRLHYVSNGNENKPLMLCVHGFPEFWYSWRYQLREFKDDYRVVAIDQRGYGDSDKPKSVSDYSVKKLVEDLAQFIKALGYEKCVLVAHDWGGVVAWRFVQKYPEMVDKYIVMNCPSTSAYQKRVKSGLSQLRKSWYIFFFQVPLLPEVTLSSLDYGFLEQAFRGKKMGVRSNLMTNEDVEAYKYTMARGGLTSPINYYRQMVRSIDFLGGSDPTKPKSNLVTRPTLIIWGDQDMALDTELAALSSKSVEGGATVKIIEGASHWVQMDQPELVNKYMREFLKE